jgi:hypothetical protein
MNDDSNYDDVSLARRREFNSSWPSELRRSVTQAALTVNLNHGGTPYGMIEVAVAAWRGGQA